MQHRLELKLRDFFVAILIAGLVSRAWVIGQHEGWIATIISMSVVSYCLNRFRFCPPVNFSSLALLPYIAVVMFLVALAFGLHHPPFIAPPNWKWSPFVSLEERLNHASLLSIWTFVYGTPAILVCGITRRLIAKSSGSWSESEGRG